MMRISFNFFLVLFLVGLLFLSCVTKVPLTSDYFQNNKKVGVIYNIDTINVYREGQQGLLDMALAHGAKYKQPLAIVDKTANPYEKIRNTYQFLFNQKNKPLQHIDFEYDVKKLSKFAKPSNSDKKYHKYDLRKLKSEGIDELLIVNVKYGLLVSYYGFIETAIQGYCRINSEIVNLTDNSVIYKNFSMGKEKVRGKWKTPPNYDNLRNSIQNAIDKTLSLEKRNLTK